MPKNELSRPYDPPYDEGYFLDILAPLKYGPRVLCGYAEHNSFWDRPDFACLLTLSDKRPAELRSKVESNNNSKRQKLNTSTSHTAMEVEFMELDTMTTTSESRRWYDIRHGDQRKVPQKKLQQSYPCHRCGINAFTRQCDLTWVLSPWDSLLPQDKSFLPIYRKHEKTHTRPYKCTTETCDFFTDGFPNEKDRDRHINDKHSQNAPQFICHYLCGYSSRRESNCKQHMEKAHGYTYTRSLCHTRQYRKDRQQTMSVFSTGQARPDGDTACPPWAMEE